MNLMMAAALSVLLSNTPSVPTGGESCALPPYRSEWIGYSTRPLAEAGDPMDEPTFVPLTDFFTTERNGRQQYRIMVDIPGLWLDRRIYLYLRGGHSSYNLYVNDRFIGTTADSRTAGEWDITDAVKKGMNTVAVEPNDSPRTLALEALSNTPGRPAIEEAWIQARPSIGIWDYTASIVPHDSGRYGVLRLDAILSSDYNYPEEVTVGYDIYSPEGDLKYYDMQTLTVAGKGCDTVHFETFVYGAMERLWCAEKPRLYRMMLYVKRGSRFVEYVPFRIGAGTIDWRGDTLYRNGLAVEIRAATYNAAPESERTREDLRGLKKQKINTIYVDYPQPAWFYDLCDELGFYVIDRVDIHPARNRRGRAVGGDLSNDPAYLPDFLDRTQRMWLRSHNHTCVTGWSLGGDCGNGYNTYKTYLWLKAQDADRPVVYEGADGEWNNDLDLPEALR